MMGSTLKAEREKKGLTIKDIEQETSIRAAYLEALEEGRYDVLPSEVYVKGFIRNYAEFLQLDPAPLVQEYREELHGADAAPVAEKTPKTTSMVNERAPFSSGSDFHERVEKSHRKQIILTAVAAVVIAFVGSIYYFFGEDPSATKPQQPAQQAATQQPQTQSAQTTQQAQPAASRPSISRATSWTPTRAPPPTAGS